ncbi:alkaline phosphatase [Parabacteroides caeci]|uniref:alkaline phosphatase n=1 Tax=Parabacteroides caeci TaxID=2949650 RepID=UPI003FCCD0F2
MKKNILFILLGIFFAMNTYNISAASPRAKHVILIGLDGWGAYSVSKAEMPNVKKLMDDGSYTLKKRSVLPSSSAVNWASMFMGAGPELHGYTEWYSKTPELPSREVNKNGIFPTVFSLLHESDPKAEIGCIYEWETIRCLVDTFALNYDKHVSEAESNPAAAAQYAADYIKKAHPNLLAVIIDNPDHVGHATGHDTPEYYAVLKELDKYVGQIVNAVKEAGMLDETIFIVTADHGGINKGHGGKTMEEMETAFIISGKNIKKGHEITESMMQFDVASTIAHIFKLEQPQVWIGQPVLSAFEK